VILVGIRGLVVYCIKGMIFVGIRGAAVFFAGIRGVIFADNYFTD